MEQDSAASSVTGDNLNVNETNEDVEDSDQGPKFCPPLYRQRYQFVGRVLEENNAFRVADFGIAECKFLLLLRNLECLEEINGIDINRQLLEQHAYLARPLTTSYIQKRERPLRVRLFGGSVTDVDSRLLGVDCVTMIELIEHLDEPVLEALPAAVFGQLRPRLVVVTTPNADFNVLFPTLKVFRHWDHRFEWTRSQFQQWCSDVAALYGYSTEFTGVGDPPTDYQGDDLGHCSQICIFRCHGDDKAVSATATSAREIYDLVTDIEYPYQSKASKMLTEAQYYMHLLARQRWEEEERLAWDGDEDGDVGYRDDGDVANVADSLSAIDYTSSPNASELDTDTITQTSSADSNGLIDATQNLNDNSSRRLLGNGDELCKTDLHADGRECSDISIPATPVYDMAQHKCCVHKTPDSTAVSINVPLTDLYTRVRSLCPDLDTLRSVLCEEKHVLCDLRCCVMVQVETEEESSLHDDNYAYDDDKDGCYDNDAHLPDDVTGDGDAGDKETRVRALVGEDWYWTPDDDWDIVSVGQNKHRSILYVTGASLPVVDGQFSDDDCT